MKIEFNNEELKIDNNYTGVLIHHTPNCKLMHFHQTDSLYAYCTMRSLDFVEVLTKVLEKLTILVDFNLSNRDIFNVIIENFPYYYAISTPTGYSMSNTYHILLKNIYSKRDESYIQYLMDKEPILNV